MPRGRIVLGLALAAAAVAWAQPAKAEAATTCTWGGTPAAPTGTFTINPGLTNIPVAGPLKFAATGELAGGDKRCRGQMRWVGQVDPGSSCAFISLEGVVKGLPGVARFRGRGNLLAPSDLYDKAGNLVGLENAQFVTEENLPTFADCNTPGGLTGPETFSSTVVLY